MVQFDKNGNGILEATELDASPGLKQIWRQLKSKQDGLSEEELKKRFETYQSEQAGAVGVQVRLIQGAKGVPDSELTFTPEKFMKDSIPTVIGKTAADGTVTGLTIGQKQVPGLSPGIYSVRASTHPNATLGCEVTTGVRGASSTIDLIIP